MYKYIYIYIKEMGGIFVRPLRLGRKMEGGKAKSQGRKEEESD